MAAATSMNITDMGPGPAYALWGFRAAWFGQTNCPTLLEGFETVFSELAYPAIGGLRELSHSIKMNGARALILACPGCCRTTPDEISLVALLANAQQKNHEACEKWVCWLTCGGASASAVTSAMGVAAVFRSAGLQFDAPQAELTLSDRRPQRVYHQAGAA